MSSGDSKTLASRRKAEVKKLLRQLGQKVYEDLERENFPEVTLASRSVSNIVYDERLKQYVLGPAKTRRSAHNINHIRSF
ncbi:MAG: DNA topoisomerase IV subunit A, partial [Nitrososphaerales archaeon]